MTEKLDRPDLAPVTVTPDQLLDVYLDGVMTGGASMLATFGAGISDDDATMLARELVKSMKADPVAVETCRVEILERIAGRDTGPKNLDVRRVR